ncbi:MAG TPA: sterol desaturase family protein [Candidatus Limnocylindrales bacterium]|nr:sterol desaturase family protein [Candidatus Limnocylindrales bacterium]
MPQIPNLIHLAIPGFFLLLLLEAVAGAIMRRDLYQLKDTAASLTMGTGNVIIGLGSKLMVLGIFTAAYRFAIFKIGWHWWAWVLIFFADDFSYYWFHRISHECRFFWASHVVHHSSQRYNLGTALRQTWTGSLMSWVFWLWLPIVGFPPMMVLTMQAISLLYQFWIHTELVRTMGPLETVMNTPSHHRVHHGSNQVYLDRNHAGILIVWDRMFGTFEPEREKVVYGLTKNINSYNPFRIAFHEWADMWRDVKNAPNWSLKLRYIFGRPGWKAEQAASAAAPSSLSGETA